MAEDAPPPPAGALGRLKALLAALLIAALAACSPPAIEPTLRPPTTLTTLAPRPSSDLAPTTGAPIPASVSGTPASASPPSASPASSPGVTDRAGSGVWQLIADFPATGAFEITSVAAAGDGFVAVGYGPLPGEGYYGRHQGFVWRSADGRAWTAEVDATFQFVTPEKVVTLGDSVYVFGTIAMCDALFSDECVEPPESGWAVWRSTAGGAWERLPQLAQMQFGFVDGVAVTGTSLVAFGSTGDEARAILWTSSDGATWTAATELGDVTQITAAAGTASGVVVLGLSDAVEDLVPVALTTTDGVTFVKASVPALVGSTISSVTAGATGLVAVGDTEGQDLELNGLALHSADGAAWSEAAATDDSFAGRAVSFVHSVPSGYVAVGIEPFEDAFGSSTGASWISADGVAWRALAPFGGEFTDLDASASSATGIVAFTVTSEEPDEQTVTSTIGAWFLQH